MDWQVKFQNPVQTIWPTKLTIRLHAKQKVLDPEK